MEMGIYNNSNAFFNHWSSNALFETELLQSEEGHCIIHRIASKKNCGIEIWEDGKMPSKSFKVWPLSIVFNANLGIS